MAFWTQTMIALNLEKHRKDFWHMFTHHIITFLLLSGSYATNFTRVGNLILCQMDVVDMILPVRLPLNKCAPPPLWPTAEDQRPPFCR